MVPSHARRGLLHGVSLLLAAFVLLGSSCAAQEPQAEQDEAPADAPEAEEALVTADQRSPWRALQARAAAAIGSDPALPLLQSLTSPEEGVALLRFDAPPDDTTRERIEERIGPLFAEAGYRLVVDDAQHAAPPTQEEGAQADASDEHATPRPPSPPSEEMIALASRIGDLGDLGRDERTEYDLADPPFLIVRAATGDRPRTYRVRAGDSLSAIAQRTMGSGALWQQLYQHNRSRIGPDPARLVEGMELDIPQD